MRDAAAFVLLDDARPGGRRTLYCDPVRTIAARTPGEVAPALAMLRAATATGLHAAGYLAYDAAPGIDPSATVLPGGGTPLLWFGLFARAEPIDDVTGLLPEPAGAHALAPAPRLTREAYDDAFARVQALIAAGDIYQANLSFRADVRVAGHPLALYARLRDAAAAGHGALVHHDDRWLLSLSPELFFRLDAGGAIEARPMKGTAARSADRAEDDARAVALAADPKQRAENLMIVDLMRNDLARIAAPGSVAVPALFEVERYPTVQQMVSRVSAQLTPGRDAVDILAALFPCGSITGAPKLRAMAVIGEVEGDARGVYTGAIGALAPDGSAGFNVAIRTLDWREGVDSATIGLGSGIVADSRADAEWDECLAKGAFVTAGQPAFDLIETMRFDPLDGIVALNLHIARLKASAEALGFAFDRHDARNELHAATFRLADECRIRIRLARSGALAIESAAMPLPPAGPVEVALVPLPVDPHDFRLRHKTSDRGFYDAARRATGSWEVLFVAPDGQLTEGSFTNLLVQRGAGPLLTPPLAAGLLPGILRAQLIDDGRAIEGRITADDLADGFFVGNALRGLIRGRLVGSAVAAGGTSPL